MQWAAVLFNVGYVVLAARRNIWCWLLGGIGVSLFFIICVEERLYSDALLQIFYLAMSVYGYVTWRKDAPIDSLTICRNTLLQHMGYIAAGVLMTILFGFFWSAFGATLPYIDAATTSFSFIATYLVARRVLENWIYWICIDLVCIGVYHSRELHLLAILFAVYTFLAVWALWKWSRDMKAA